MKKESLMPRKVQAQRLYLLMLGYAQQNSRHSFLLLLRPWIIGIIRGSCYRKVVTKTNKACTTKRSFGVL